MKTARHFILDWAEQGHIAPEHLRRSLSLAGALPSAAAWRRFLDYLLLGLGTLLLASGVIFFVAYNWNDLGRFAKFALIEGVVLVALAAVWRLDLDSMGGKAALFAAALFVGALLALIGQTYQTGADTFELFGSWALAILPWALAGRFATLWMLWLALLNVAIAFYYQALAGPLGILFSPQDSLWVLFALNTLALALWENLAASGFSWLRERWATRVLATASGGLATALALIAILDGPHGDVMAVPVWLAWLAGAYAFYRSRMPDIYVLAGGVLSVIVVVTVLLSKHLLDGRGEAGAFLFIGLAVIALAAAGAWWLKGVFSEEIA